jgi:hypothetical protein
VSTQVTEFNPYTTTIPFSGSARPKHLTDYDFWRITSYQIYEQIYWNVPDTFALVARGTEASPIYVPTARTIVDTTMRYVGKDLGWVVQPGLGDQTQADELNVAMTALFARERFLSKYNMNKRYGMIRGDSIYHLLGNPLRPQGQRISIIEVDPAAYFPITHPDNPDQIIGVHLIEVILDVDKTFVKRQTYTRGADPVNNDGSDLTVYTETAIFDMEKWQSLDDKAVKTIVPYQPLPPDITSLPVYHVRNIEEPGNPYGSSELRGFERIMAAVNQAVSDEELALALEGLGLYATDADPPVDPDTGLPVNWRLGPGKVVEVAPDRNFNRVNGISSVSPVQDHLGFLIDQLRQGAGVPEAAIGKVDVSVAESGIALALQLAPMIAKADERNQTIIDVFTQMFFDLKSWFAAYEGLRYPDALPVPVLGDAMPFNRSARVTEILNIVAAGIASAEWGRTELAKLGYTFDANEGNLIVAETLATAEANDPFAARAAGETVGSTASSTPQQAP